MFTCRLCRFDVCLDDTFAVTASGGCICLRCFLVRVEDHRPLPGRLRRTLTELAGTA
jgi:hypothetical protein